MQYYKLIKDGAILGVVTSNNFFSYSPVTNCFLRADETTGEYISYKGQLYRSPWMAPIMEQKPYIPVTTLQISEEEYNIHYAALQTNETIQIEQEEAEEIEDPTFDNPNDIATIEFVRNSKVAEMSRACRLAIEGGFDLEIHGETKHFSLTTQDQLNLMSLSSTVQAQELIPYHADGEACEFYTASEINEIINEATSFKNYQIAYNNALKIYINALESIEDISSITYGIDIPEEYKTDVLKVLEY